MNAPIRSALVVAVAFLLAVCLFGLRFACDSSELRKLIQEDRRREQLQQIQREQSRYYESRERIVNELIAQRCSPSEALARWEKLDFEYLQRVERECPGYDIGTSLTYQLARSDADYFFRTITKQAAELLSDRPEEAASLLRRLEKEYQQLRASRQTSPAAPVERKGPGR